MKQLLFVLATCAVVGLPALAQEPPAAGASPRIDAIKKAGVLRVGVLANAPWLVENTTGRGTHGAAPPGCWRTSMRSASA